MSREHDAPDADAPVTIQLSPTARIHTFPKRKPRFTAQDHEDMSDARRVLFLRQAIRQLEAMHHCLHEVFGEVVRTDDAWPFFSVNTFAVPSGSMHSAVPSSMPRPRRRAGFSSA